MLQEVKLADLGAHERSKNPDAGQSYGFQGIDPACVEELPKEIPGPYPGIKDSHPYATASLGRTSYVADAAAHAILKIDAKGKVSTVAVLPPVPLTVTAEVQSALDLPACTVGLTFLFEPVPTDVELAGKGSLVVTLLPGGPEDGSTGANGRVVSVRISNGKVRTIATGLLGATGVAVAGNGDLFVAQLFGGQVSRIKKGSDVAKPYAQVKMPAAVEWSRGGVYLSANVMAEGPNGKILRY